MEELQKLVEDTTNSLKIIRDRNSEIEKTYTRYLLCVTDNSDIYDELFALIDKNYGELSSLLNKIKKEKPTGKATTEDRIHTNIYNMLIQKIQITTKEFQEIQTKYKEIEMEKIKRDLRIKFPRLSEKEISQVVGNLC